MTALATVTDLENRTGSTVSAADLPRAMALLDDASAAVRAYTNQDITQSTTTERLNIVGGVRIKLPQRPVTNVASVTTIDGTPIRFTWDGYQVVSAWVTYVDPMLTFMTTPVQPILYADVTYTHGYAAGDPKLDIVAGVVAGVAARAMSVPAGSGNITSETIGGYSYQVGSTAAQGGYGLLSGEQMVLQQLFSAAKAGSIDVRTPW